MASSSWLARRNPGRFEPPAGQVVVRARAGAPPTNGRTRPRIGGLAWVEHAPRAPDALARSLGTGARLLLTGQNPEPVGSADFVGDWDACYLGDRRLDTAADWLGIIRTGCLSSVEGAFVLAWLGPSGTLNLVRDGVGERTLYYLMAGRGVAFASSVHALLATGLSARSVDRVALASYLSYAYVPGRRTLVEGVHELLPGEHLVVGQGPPVRRRLWSLPPEPEPADRPSSGEAEAAHAADLRARLEQAVDRRLPASGEAVGVTLSGGLDSSAVTALAARRHRGPVHTYSVSFGRRYPNELAFSSLVASHFGTTHRIVELSPAAMLRDLDRSIAMLSTPIGDPLTVPNALLFRQASSEVGVVLNGEGGDPCFGGPKNLPMVLALLYGEPALDVANTYLRVHRKCYDDLDRILDGDMRSALIADLGPWLADPRWHTVVNRLMAMNVSFKGGHHILPKVDQISVAAGVLPRSPLFDRSVVELALSVPPQCKLKGSVEKHLLKRAVADLVPDVIIDRPKSGMRVPVESWFAGPLLGAARERLMDGLAPSGLVNPDYLRGLVDRHSSYRRRGVKIWLMLTLEAWLRTVLRD